MATRTGRAIFLINGTQGAGKSTVARLLAGRFEQGVCIDADDILRLIVSGAVPLEHPLSFGAQRQLRLRARVTSQLADTFFEAGFTVAIGQCELRLSRSGVDAVLADANARLRRGQLCDRTDSCRL